LKILQIKLLAFGLFTDAVIDLNGGREGLHLIYGPNEAGKSCALRALRQMLFGIPERSLDNFRHPYPQMRIGGVLQHSDGSVIEFVRRKGRVNTLQSKNDKDVLDAAVLEKFIGGTDADLFGTMFGIGHEDLVRGGEEIIRGGGNVGQALFAAGSGIADLRQIQTALQSEAEALFAPSASKRRINEALAELRRNQKELREAELPGQEWAKHDQALSDALKRKDQVDRQLEQVKSERNKQERIQQALQLISRRKELLQEFKGYADAILLPEDFGEKRRDFLADLRIAENARDQAIQAIEEIKKDRAQLEMPETLLESGDTIEQVYKELGSFQKAAKDRV
jgi:uncharacterized protein YhaN